MEKTVKTTSFEEFSTVLREHEIKTFSKFVCVKSDKAFTEAKFTPTVNLKIHWNNDIPHYYIGCRVYACHQGKDTNLYQKKRYAQKRDSKACKEHDFIDRRDLTKPTKKLGCPVVINVSRMLALPRFKVSKLTKWEKTKMAEIIKKKVEEGEIAGENVYSFNLPDEASHQNHIVGLTAAVTETIDPKVRSKIKELVSQGECNISVITALVEEYVINELGETDKLRSRFYPQRACIRNIVNAMKRKIKWSKNDLENVEQLVKSSKIATMKERIDPKVRSKIKELVYQGEHNISVITALVEEYVINQLGETDKSKSRFYPHRTRIRSIVNAVKQKIKGRKIDLENTEQLMKSSEEKSGRIPNEVYVLPCTLEQTPYEICIPQEESDDDCEEENQTLKWKQMYMINSTKFHPALSALSWLFGVWESVEAAVFHPAMETLKYKEIMKYSPTKQPVLEYKSKSWCVSTKTTLHCEKGFLRIDPGSNKLALITSHKFGLSELSEGSVEKESLSLESQSFSKVSFCEFADPVKVIRKLCLKGDDLYYTVLMETVDQPLQLHVQSRYKKKM